jgi:hypothetical protein
MDEYYVGTSEEMTPGERDEGIDRLEFALNKAAQKYFDRNPDKQSGPPVKFDVVELRVTASHNPIHDYIVTLRPGG